MNFLFVGGPPRSGTTAFTKYLNEHPEVLVCRERFKWLPQEQVSRELFTFERILDFEDGYEKRDTERRQKVHEELLTRKNPEELKWMGDKFPGYVNMLDTLSENNPGASFIIMYRPVEEVAESFEARSRNPNDAWLAGRDGFRLGVRHWNAAMRSARDFIESGVNPNVLVVSYHDFFYRNGDCVPLISRFLNLDFDESMREVWKETSRQFEEKRRHKEPLIEEQQSLIEEQADREAEKWVLDRIKRQWKDLDRHSPETVRALVEERRRFAVLMARERANAKANKPRRPGQRNKELARKLGKERQRTKTANRENQRLTEQVQNLRDQIQAVQSSRTRRLLDRMKRVRKKLGIS